MAFGTGRGQGRMAWQPGRSRRPGRHDDRNRPEHEIAMEKEWWL